MKDLPEPRTRPARRGPTPPGPPPPGPPPPGPPPEVLPSALAGALAAFERHLRSERSLSPHTVRAYAGDIASLLAYASIQGIDTPNRLGVTELRGWLAIQHESGAARATLARRGAAARAFTAFAHRRGWLATDPGPQLGTPKARRTLPHVLPRDEMAGVLTGLDQAARRTQVTLRTEAAERVGSTHPTDAAGPAGAEAAVALRDSAVSLFYATGIRVSELCGLDAGHLDQGRRTVRVRGKGDKERTVPVGVPALRAVTRWLDAGRPALATAASGTALFVGVRGGRLDRARRAASCTSGCARRARPGTPAARDPPQHGDPPPRGRRRPAQRPGDPRPLFARHHADLHPRLDRAPQVQLPPGPPPRLAGVPRGRAASSPPAMARAAPSPSAGTP